MARNILRRLSIFGSRLSAGRLASSEISTSLVTPSTRLATSGAELFGQVGDVGRGILGNVVQQRRGHGLRVQAQIGQDAGDGQRMDDIRLARDALLSIVRRFGQGVARAALARHPEASSFLATVGEADPMS